MIASQPCRKWQSDETARAGFPTCGKLRDVATETELKLALNPRDLPRLLEHPVLTGQAPRSQRLLNTYFDTPDLALMRQRIAVRERQVGRQTLLTVKTAGTSVGGLSRRGEWEGPTRAGTLDFGALVDDAALARALKTLAPRLVPVFRTDFVRRSWLLQVGGAEIEVAIDQGTIRATPAGSRSVHRQTLLELELELKQGPADALLDLAHTLALGPSGMASQGLWLYPSDRSKAERGLALFLQKEVEAVRETALQLPATGSPVRVFCTTAQACLAQLQPNVLGLLATPAAGPLPDPEFVHQARVALRRLRTGLRLFGPHLPRRWVAYWNGRFQATAHVLGEARNWDVLATEWLPQLAGPGRHNDAMARWVETRRRQAYEDARRWLERPEHALDQLAFMRALWSLAAEDVQTRPARPLAPWALATWTRYGRRLRQQTGRTTDTDPQAWHALRIDLKKLRYAQSFLSSLLPPGLRDIGPLKRAQDLLGALNDLSTAQQLLSDAPQPARDPVLGRIEELIQVRLAELPRMEDELLRALKKRI